MRVAFSASSPRETERRTGLDNYARCLRHALRAAGVECADCACLEGVAARPDVIHLLAPGLPPPLALGVPLILTVHDLAWRRFPADYYPDAVRRFEQFLREWLPQVAAVIVPSTSTLREVAAWPGLKAPVYPVPMGVDTGLFRPNLPPPPATPTPYILNVASWVGRKNIPGLIRAFAGFARSRYGGDYSLVLAGEEIPGMPGKGREIRRAIAEDGLTEKVSLRGYVPDEELPGLYAGAGLLAFPSLEEGFGLPVLEAMACGVPVVTGNRSSLPEVVGDAGILIDPEDRRELAAGMAAVLHDGALAAQLRRAGWERARRFTWERTAQRTLEVYRSLLA